MKTDTAHEHWNAEWQGIDAESKWMRPEPEVLDWAAGFAPGAHVLDLGAGVGRHALALARDGVAVTAIDAAPRAVEAIARAARDSGRAVAVHEAPMTALPLEAASVDHVLAWNVIYHGDGAVVRAAVAEIARVLRPGGTFLGTMLSARRLAVEQARHPGREIAPGTWVFDDGGKGDKRHPHHFCRAAELVALFEGFETLRLEDREQDGAGSWHWHLKMERL